MSNKPAAMPASETQAPEEFHASKVAEVHAFLNAALAGRGDVISSSTVDREDHLGRHEVPVEVTEAILRMRQAMEAFDEVADVTSLSDEGFRAVIDRATARKYLGDNLEDAVFIGHRTDEDAYELSLRLSEMHRNPDGTLRPSMGNWGTTTVELKPDSVRVHTRDNKNCVWAR